MRWRAPTPVVRRAEQADGWTIWMLEHGVLALASGSTQLLLDAPSGARLTQPISFSTPVERVAVDRAGAVRESRRELATPRVVRWGAGHAEISRIDGYSDTAPFALLPPS